jgi:isopenicillin N synthase-like dioxygenase
MISEERFANPLAVLDKMATQTLSPQAVPNPPYNSDNPPPTKLPATSPYIDEVRAAQSQLVTRLAGAISSPPPHVPESSLPTVPLIDLGPSFDGTVTSRAKVASEIRAACLTTGFFQISNHSITPAATSGILTQAKRFFHELTPEQKDALHIRHSAYFRGYEPGNASYTGDARNQDVDVINQQAETKEAFNFGYEPAFDPTGGDGRYVELDGSDPSVLPGGTANVWPDEALLPGFRAGVAEYYAQVLALARHLFQLFALSLGVDEGHFDGKLGHPGGVGRLLWYPPSSLDDEAEEDGGVKLGLGAHTDYECFTLLLSSANPGLEILFPPSPLTDNRPIWRPCPVRQGTLTVNVADFLMRWTNGLYKSTIHRVVTRPTGSDEGRYSVPFFFSIDYDADVEELPVKMLDEGEGEGIKYKPMRAGEYVLERLRATMVLEEENGGM